MTACVFAHVCACVRQREYVCLSLKVRGNVCERVVKPKGINQRLSVTAELGLKLGSLYIENRNKYYKCH